MPGHCCLVWRRLIRPRGLRHGNGEPSLKIYLPELCTSDFGVGCIFVRAEGSSWLWAGPSWEWWFIHWCRSHHSVGSQGQLLLLIQWIDSRIKSVAKNENRSLIVCVNCPEINRCETFLGFIGSLDRLLEFIIWCEINNSTRSPVRCCLQYLVNSVWREKQLSSLHVFAHTAT